MIFVNAIADRPTSLSLRSEPDSFSIVDRNNRNEFLSHSVRPKPNSLRRKTLEHEFGERSQAIIRQRFCRVPRYLEKGHTTDYILKGRSEFRHFACQVRMVGGFGMPERDLHFWNRFCSCHFCSSSDFPHKTGRGCADNRPITLFGRPPGSGEKVHIS
jgi:hypothetical protein